VLGIVAHLSSRIDACTIHRRSMRMRAILLALLAVVAVPVVAVVAAVAG
jgi:hypothetical protein